MPEDPDKKDIWGRRMQLVDFDQIYSASDSARVITDRMYTDNLIRDRTGCIYSDSERELGFIGRCSCGEKKGNFFLGTQCSICKTIVSYEFADKIHHENWIGIPESIAPVLHPVAYFVLSNWLSFKSVKENSILDAILCPDKDLPEDLKDVIVKQGFSYFYENFDSIIQFFLNSYPKTANKDNEDIKEFIRTYRNVMFVRKLPILNSALHPLTKSGSMKQADAASKKILDAINDMSAVILTINKGIKSPIKIDRMMYGVYIQIIRYMQHIITEKVGKKEGINRQHLCGSRLHHTIRAVIIPFTGPTEGDEIHIPWGMAVETFKLEILNLLVNRNHYSAIDAINKHAKSRISFDQEIYDILCTLIKESPDKGIPVLLGRNPTLQLCSIQNLYITRIKTNINDETISVSSLIKSSPNFDFDGDELYGLLIKERKYVIQFFKAIHPCRVTLNHSSLRASTSVTLTDQSLVCLNEWKKDVDGSKYRND